MEFNNMFFAFTLTLLAGLATGIGSAIAFFAKTTNTRFLSLALGFSAGVMLYVSFVELFNEARVDLIGQHGEGTGYFIATISFFGGLFLIAIIDKFVPENFNPHEMKKVEDMNMSKRNSALMRMGLFTAAAIAIHNFPEGLATFVTAMADPQLGISIAIAIAIHNIPEGIAISVPIYYATGSRKKAFKYSFFSGLAEPLGALAGILILQYFFSESIMGILLAAVAGIMVFISLDELLPAAQRYGEHHLSIYGLISGMAVMALSLLMLG